MNHRTFARSVLAVSLLLGAAASCDADPVRHCNDPIDATNGSANLSVTVHEERPDDAAEISGTYDVYYSCDLLHDEYVLADAALFEVDQETKIADLDDLQFAGGSLIIAGPDCTDDHSATTLTATGPANSVLAGYCGQNVWLTAFVKRADCDDVSGVQEVGSQLVISCPDS